MILRSRLPLNHWLPGIILVEGDDGAVVLGPFPCRGKADSQIAAKHGNPERYPTLPFGDHPYGAYHIVGVQANKLPKSSYGPFFLLLDPMAGDALRAKQNGREGLGVHGGSPDPKPGPYGPLRATEGCLRMRDEDVAAVAALNPARWDYVCEELKP